MMTQRNVNHAYEAGKRNLSGADRRIRMLEQAFNIAAPVLGVLQPQLAPALAATKFGFYNYNNARSLAMAGDKIKSALTP